MPYNDAMYYAFNKPHVFSEGYYFFTFANKEACARFKQAVSSAGVGRFLTEPVWGDGDQNRDRYTPEGCMRWGYTIYAFMAHTGAKGMLRGNWVENLVSPGDTRHYLRIHVPGLEGTDPYWQRLVSHYR